ncbi:MAG: protein-L-isoaspartate(D-aspartate) O-methyltransferase, partial [Balneolaceae bacterium]|nr:protein-L-isoaspartate(D-aspartate) O-methyltransferase [Balneolaceae bacterium]
YNGMEPNKRVFSAMTDTMEWEKPRFDERKEERHRMVEKGIKGRGVTDKATLEAMRHVPRHLFVPDDRRSSAYENRPLPIGYKQTISQPYIVGYMTQLLQLEAGEKVLEIGTGSGYQAAILSEITPHVFTIEIVEELGRQAKERFDSLGYHTIQTRIGDGYKGWPENAPFDAIILTAAADEIPQPLIEQLKPGGVMVLPVGEGGLTQRLIRVRKTEDGEIETERKLPVRFVPMTGIDEKN